MRQTALFQRNICTSGMSVEAPYKPNHELQARTLILYFSARLQLLDTTEAPSATPSSSISTEFYDNEQDVKVQASLHR
jgi:hypothetical protein